MTKRFKTLMRNGKFMCISESVYLRESENPFLLVEDTTIKDIKNYFRGQKWHFAQWIIDESFSDLDQCELVTIEVKVVNDIPERVKTDKTSSE